MASDVKRQTKFILPNSILSDIRTDRQQESEKSKSTEKQIDRWHPEYELRQFIDIALRWPIDLVVGFFPKIKHVVAIN